VTCKWDVVIKYKWCMIKWDVVIKYKW
jgi:hypothetical protein